MGLLLIQMHTVISYYKLILFVVVKCENDKKKTADKNNWHNVQWYNKPKCINSPSTFKKTDLETDNVSKEVRKIDKCSNYYTTFEDDSELLEIVKKEKYASQGDLEPKILTIWSNGPCAYVNFTESQQSETSG